MSVCSSAADSVGVCDGVCDSVDTCPESVIGLSSDVDCASVCNSVDACLSTTPGCGVDGHWTRPAAQRTWAMTQ